MFLIYPQDDLTIFNPTTFCVFTSKSA